MPGSEPRIERRGIRTASTNRRAIISLPPSARLASIGRISICVLVLLWPALLNGQYIVFYDTAAYIRGAARAFDLLLGIESEWAVLYDPKPDLNASVKAITAEAQRSADGHVVAGRSVYYGMMIYIGALLGSMWSGLVVQSLAVVLAVYIVFRAFGREQSATRSILVIGLATPASFFASYLMPDVFAAIAILGVASLALLWDRLRPWMRVAMAGLLLASLLFHTSHLALALALAVPACLASLLCSGSFQRRGALLVAATIVLAIGAEAAFYRAVEAVYGHPPTRPPFLMARVVADGPGTEYLRSTCPNSGFVLCGYLDALPMGVDPFLWSDKGVYGGADIPMREALSREEKAFVLASFWYDPMAQVVASLSNAFEQLSQFSLAEFNYSEGLARMMSVNMPPAVLRDFVHTSLYKKSFPLEKIDLLYRAVFAGAAVYLLISMFRWTGGGHAEGPSSRRSSIEMAAPRADGRLLLVFVAVVLLGVLLNAAITGALSGPHDRYQARVIWLVPMLALLVHAWRRGGSGRGGKHGG